MVEVRRLLAEKGIAADCGWLQREPATAIALVEKITEDPALKGIEESERVDPQDKLQPVFTYRRSGRENSNRGQFRGRERRFECTIVRNVDIAIVHAQRACALYVRARGMTLRRPQRRFKTRQDTRYHKAHEGDRIYSVFDQKSGNRIYGTSEDCEDWRLPPPCDSQQ